MKKPKPNGSRPQLQGKRKRSDQKKSKMPSKKEHLVPVSDFLPAEEKSEEDPLNALVDEDGDVEPVDAGGEIIPSQGILTFARKLADTGNTLYLSLFASLSLRHLPVCD